MEYGHDRQRSYYQHAEKELDRDTVSQLQDELDDRAEEDEQSEPGTEQLYKQFACQPQKRSFMYLCSSLACAFMEGWRMDNQIHKQEKELRENLSEKQIDKMVEDSFPSSDPPSTY